uniref:Uncharacterized protein n=3 Tax=Aegilops tauschii subsp. strangulata TaxID=200361 RepID=A0A452Y8L5_AEGTS
PRPPTRAVSPCPRPCCQLQRCGLVSAPTEFPSSSLHRERSAGLPTSGLLATWPTRRWRRCDQVHYQAASLNLHSERCRCSTAAVSRPHDPNAQARSAAAGSSTESWSCTTIQPQCINPGHLYVGRLCLVIDDLQHRPAAQKGTKHPALRRLPLPPLRSPLLNS